jgi:stearoyl-CoA desaturase (delta-9 desaturase)
MWERVLHVFALLSFEGPVIGYSALHRTHHRHSDTVEDPIPGNKWHATFTSFYTIPFERYSKMTVRDLLTSPWNIFTNANYYTLYIGAMLLACMIDYKMACYWLIFPSLFCIIPSTIVNWRCHTAGERPYNTNDTSTNNIMANWLIVGQGLHNNHHADPAAYHMEREWWQFDFYKSLIDYLIAKEVREPK